MPTCATGFQPNQTAAGHLVPLNRFVAIARWAHLARVAGVLPRGRFINHHCHLLGVFNVIGAGISFDGTGLLVLTMT